MKIIASQTKVICLSNKEKVIEAGWAPRVRKFKSLPRVLVNRAPYYLSKIAVFSGNGKQKNYLGIRQNEMGNAVDLLVKN